jgi:hypothetical protein
LLTLCVISPSLATAPFAFSPQKGRCVSRTFPADISSHSFRNCARGSSAQSASSNGNPRLHHSYVIDQAGQQAYVICRGSLSDGDARATAGSTWVENIHMSRRRSLRHWCCGCTGQVSSIPKRWTNLESSLFSLSFERSIGIRAEPLGRWECTGALSFALFEN